VAQVVKAEIVNTARISTVSKLPFHTLTLTRRSPLGEKNTILFPSQPGLLNLPGEFRAASARYRIFPPLSFDRTAVIRP